MIKKTQITVVLLFLGIVASAQVKIGANPTVVNPNSILELESTNKGLLMSRVALMSTTNFSPLAAHIQGMMVYNTASTGDVLPGIYTNNGLKWVAAVGTNDASATAGGMINTTTQTLGTGAKTFTNDLIVNGLTIGKGSGNKVSNTAMGEDALKVNGSDGFQNTAIGFNALAANTNGKFNTAIGMRAQGSNASGQHNTAVGVNSLNNLNTGTQNTAVGSFSMKSLVTGNDNTAIGYNTIFSGLFSNSIAIGSGANIFASNSIQIGNTSITSANIQVAWTTTSDRRWKSDIKTSNLGLDFINQLHPVSYLRKNDENKKTEYGFIAQELEETLNKIGITNAGILSKDGDGMYQVRYNDFIAPMVKAIQEQQITIEAQQKQIDTLKMLVEQLLTKK